MLVPNIITFLPNPSLGNEKVPRISNIKYYIENNNTDQDQDF